MSDILNFNNSLYEAKDNIMKYGGAYAGTVSPNSNCSFQNSDGNYVINVSESCYSIQEGHAMHVIGWDDNYEYEYCDVGKYNRTPAVVIYQQAQK